MHRRLQLWVVPVQVRLLREKGVEVPLAGALVEGPGFPHRPEARQPIVRRPATRRAVPPDVPVALGVVPAGARSDEPGMLVGGVVGDPVQDHLDSARVTIFNQPVQAFQAAKDRVDVAVVGHVVAEVGHGRGVDGREPGGLHPERREVIEVRRDAAEIAHAVTVAVREGPRVDLIDGPALPPRRLGHLPDTLAPGTGWCRKLESGFIILDKGGSVGFNVETWAW